MEITRAGPGAGGTGGQATPPTPPPVRPRASETKCWTAKRARVPEVRLDGEAGTEDAPDEVRVRAELVEARDVAGGERGALVRGHDVAREIVVGEPVLHRVLARDGGEDLVERVGRVHGCTHTVAQPVIHSATGS